MKFLKGTVEKWFDFRGFGFIKPEEGGDSIFVHSSDIKGATALRQGQNVEFEVEDAPKGPKAVNVNVVAE